MASSSVKECSICDEEFNEEERCPRSLPCSHGFCTDCIGQLINKNDKKCPLCRQSFDAKSAKYFKINTIALDLVNYIKAMEAKFESSRKESTKSRSAMVTELKQNGYETCDQNIASLKSEEDRIQKTIDSNEELKLQIMDNYSKIKNDVISKLNDLQEECEVKLAYIDAEIEMLKNKLGNIREQQKRNAEVNTKLGAATKLSQIDEALDEAEAFNDDAKKWLHDFKTSFSRAEKIQQQIQMNNKKVEDKVTAIIKVLATSVRDDVLAKEEMAVAIFEQYKQKVLTAYILRNMSMSTKCLVRLEGIYAVHQHEGKRRCAKLSISKDKVLLHCLKEGPLPPDVFTLKHHDVMGLIYPSSRLVFLELGVNESSLGRIFIRMTPDTKRAQNFSALCTGEKGPRYVNTVLLSVKFKGIIWEAVLGGDYENNDESGGKAVVAGAGEEGGGVLQRPLLAGSVYGWWGNAAASKFVITTRDDSNNKCMTAFGIVESGLNILNKTISLYPNIKDVKIIDSGIVLPL